jgi:hypothetical protein
VLAAPLAWHRHRLSFNCLEIELAASEHPHDRAGSGAAEAFELHAFLSTDGSASGDVASP